MFLSRYINKIVIKTVRVCSQSKKEYGLVLERLSKENFKTPRYLTKKEEVTFKKNYH